MSDKKYFWLKLKKDFFKRHDIQIIESRPNGKDYVLFYLKLLVESVDHNGELRFNDTIPYSEEMLAIVTNTNVDVVRSAMKMLIDLKLIDVLDDQTIFMREVEKMLGTETYWAEQKRRQRCNEPKLIGQCPQNVQDVQPLSNQEIDIELDIEKEKDNKTLLVAPENTEQPNEQENEEKFPLTEFVATCINYLNNKANTHYKPTTPKTVRLIQSRLNEGFAPTDFQRVIDIKCKKWLGDKQMQQYLRPETLFGTKFESYLNEKVGT